MSKIALITGGAKRIGKHLAIAYAKQGYDIALHVGKSDGSSTVKEIEKLGQRAKIFPANLQNSKEVENLLTTVIESFGTPEVLINSAAVFDRGIIQQTNADLLVKEFSINFFAPFLLSRDFYQYCKRGHILNFLDTSIQTIRTKYSAYLLSKKALAEFTKMAAYEFAPHIRVNAISPGPILPPADKDESYFKKVGKTTLLQRTGNPDHIVQAALFLQNHDYITGQILHVDGGGYAL
ncbi:MAG: SDR family oxidoreductase [Candidatus Hydrogenedentota bacterium]|nr:MAG: SDR family oxidoreductase [Candidatus Hydrogenedentota bacterium]